MLMQQYLAYCNTGSTLIHQSIPFILDMCRIYQYLGYSDTFPFTYYVVLVIILCNTP